MLVVVIDALRPDTVPDLPMDFDRAVAPATWTFPSVTSMQTGLEPHDHGAVAHTHPNDKDYAMPAQYDGSPTLPHVIERSGYDTYLGAAFMMPFLALQSWFQFHRVYDDVDAEQVIDDYRDWRANRNRTYAYLQLGDLHAPIEPPGTYIEARNVDTTLDGLHSLRKYTDDYDSAPEGWRDQRLNLYCAALDYVSDTLRPFIADYREDTLIVVTGDHGEAMWEHHERDRQFADSRPNYGVGHGGTPYDEVARVPIALAHPNRAIDFGGGHPSGCDLPRTICAGLGIDEPNFPGENWFSDIPSDRAALCEATRYGTERKAIYCDGEKVIHSKSDSITFGATLEGGETFDSLDNDRITTLCDRLPNAWDDFGTQTNTSAMVQNRLEALGYR